MGFLCARIGRELVGSQIVIAQVLISAGGIVTSATEFNALTNHGTCTVTFALVSALLVTLCSSIRTFSRLGWLTWAGFVTFVLAVTQQDRPAAAPPAGDFDLGWVPVAYPNFVVGMLNAENVYISTSGSSMFLPVIPTMRRPQGYLATPAFGSAGPLFPTKKKKNFVGRRHLPARGGQMCICTSAEGLQFQANTFTH